MYEDSLSSFPPLSREDEDLRERSVKKSKRGDRFELDEGVDVVLETPMQEEINEDMHAHNGTDYQRHEAPKLSFRSMLSAGMATIDGENKEDNTYADSDDDVYDKEEDEADCPLICLTKEEKAELRGKWRNSLIVKVWGRTVGYTYLLKRLKTIWKPKAFLDLVALENGYFLVKFYAMEDYKFARDEGPWTVLDHYLVVKEWAPDFDPMTDRTEKLIVWVRFPCLPIEYFDWKFLKKVGEKIGRPIRADQNTGTTARGRFARLCVEVDITKPLLARFKLRKRVRTIEYEGIHLVCFGCGIYGHRQDECPRLTKVDKPREDPTVVDGHRKGGERTAANNRERTVGEETDGRLQVRKEISDESWCNEKFGPWMIARKSERKNNKTRFDGHNGKITKGKNDIKEGESRWKKSGEKDVGTSSRYNVLYGLEEFGEGKNFDEEEGQERESPAEKAQVEEVFGPVQREREEAREKIKELDLKTAQKGKNINKKKIQEGVKENYYKEVKTVLGMENSENKADNNQMSTEIKINSSSRKAAAEEEHTVVRGTNKGTNITRTVVRHEHEGSFTCMEEDTYMHEHHADPPRSEMQDDCMLVEHEEPLAEDTAMGGLVPEGGVACS